MELNVYKSRIFIIITTCVNPMTNTLVNSSRNVLLRSLVRHTPLRTHSLLSSNRDVTYPRMLLFWPGLGIFYLSLPCYRPCSYHFLGHLHPGYYVPVCDVKVVLADSPHAILLLNNHWRGNYIKLQTRLVTQLYLSSRRIIIILLVYCPDKTTEIVVTL